MSFRDSERESLRVLSRIGAIIETVRSLRHPATGSLEASRRADHFLEAWREYVDSISASATLIHSNVDALRSVADPGLPFRTELRSLIGSASAHESTIRLAEEVFYSVTLRIAPEGRLRALLVECSSPTLNEVELAIQSLGGEDLAGELTTIAETASLLRPLVQQEAARAIVALGDSTPSARTSSQNRTRAGRKPLSADDVRECRKLWAEYKNSGLIKDDFVRDRAYFGLLTKEEALARLDQCRKAVGRKTKPGQ